MRWKPQVASGGGAVGSSVGASARWIPSGCLCQGGIGIRPGELAALLDGARAPRSSGVGAGALARLQDCQAHLDRAAPAMDVSLQSPDAAAVQQRTAVHDRVPALAHGPFITPSLTHSLLSLNMYIRTLAGESAMPLANTQRSPFSRERGRLQGTTRARRQDGVGVTTGSKDRQAVEALAVAGAIGVPLYIRTK